MLGVNESEGQERSGDLGQQSWTNGVKADAGWTQGTREASRARSWFLASARLGPPGLNVPELSRVLARDSVDEDALAHAAGNDGGHGARRLVSDNAGLSGADTRGGLAANEARLGDLVGCLLLALAAEELAPPGLMLGGRGSGGGGGGGCGQLSAAMLWCSTAAGGNKEKRTHDDWVGGCDVVRGRQVSDW
ncbi:hypothetical protein A1Q2_04146 [Trichosporon asahii var. asahii CBS 8904]|uniref:Uncharacterized protein n=1 Tax=Trichosporon asahii var. asahii (strain CBS 8904) TaxID=1220162 RepID=K1VC89_TRIAC|nr:hypothetical protein A1Q2_04146 [Trichosporon asahii var. asahii CBS 8904]